MQNAALDVGKKTYASLRATTSPLINLRRTMGFAHQHPAHNLFDAVCAPS